MKFTKLRQLALATFAFCGLTLGSHMTAIASETITDPTPEAVTMKLHKLDNVGDGMTKTRFAARLKTLGMKLKSQKA